MDIRTQKTDRSWCFCLRPTRQAVSLATHTRGRRSAWQTRFEWFVGRMFRRAISESLRRCADDQPSICEDPANSRGRCSQRGVRSLEAQDVPAPCKVSIYKRKPDRQVRHANHKANGFDAVSAHTMQRLGAPQATPIRQPELPMTGDMLPVVDAGAGTAFAIRPVHRSCGDDAPDVRRGAREGGM